MRCLLLISLLLLTAAPAAAQHGFGAREQWQPQLAPADPRLDQAVEIEFTGRAAVPVTEMLSEATGVSLGLAPEDLATLGERKLTIISKDLTLKTIMVQIPEALQECHWDIDPSGDEPVYLLHRNAGVEASLQRQEQDRRAHHETRMQQQRLDSIEDARRALAMSSEELAELERTDLFLARAARHPLSRQLMSAYASLPEEYLSELVETGGVRRVYGELPPALREAVRSSFELQRRHLLWAASRPQEERVPFREERGELEQYVQQLADQIAAGPGADLEVTIRDSNGREVSWGATLSVDLGEVSVSSMMIPARYTRMSFHGNPYEWLLVETGDTVEDARKAVERSKEEWFDLRDRRQWDESEWVEPSDSRLHQQVSAPTVFVEGWGDCTDLADLQQLIAEHTGLSIISDYFTEGPIGLHPGQRPLGGPLWRDLYVLGQAGRFEWKLVGDCLVFHREDWYLQAQRELPESFIERWRTKLEDRERFTLDDIVQLAYELEHRPWPRFRGFFGFAVPGDLLEAGAHAASGPYRGMLLLYHALTPEERAAARTPDGLPLSQLPPRKQREIADYVLPPGMPRATLQTPVPEFVAGMEFFLDAGSGEEAGAPPTQYEFRLTYPSDLMLSMGDWTFGVRVAPDLPADDAE